MKYPGLGYISDITWHTRVYFQVASVVLRTRSQVLANPGRSFRLHHRWGSLCSLKNTSGWVWTLYFESCSLDAYFELSWRRPGALRTELSSSEKILTLTVTFLREKLRGSVNEWINF